NQGGTAQAWWRFFRQKYPDEKPLATMERIRKLMAGDVKARDLADLAEHLEKAAKELFTKEESARWMLALAEVARRAGRSPLRRTAIPKAVDTASTPDLLVQLGDAHADEKDWGKAALFYGKAWDADRSQPLPLFLRGWALQQAGDDKEGKKLIELSHLLPLAD